MLNGLFHPYQMDESISSLGVSGVLFHLYSISNIRISNGREVRIENSVTASRGLPSDAEQLYRVTEFSI